jgi:hypothetical protein
MTTTNRPLPAAPVDRGPSVFLQNAAMLPDCLTRRPEMAELIAARPDGLRNCSADIARSPGRD